MIRLEFIGTLGKDAIVKEVGDKKVINFSVAVNEHSTAGGEKTIWIECAKWGEKTGVAPFLKKGVKVFVDGRPEIKHYQKQDGTTGTSLTVQVASIELLGGNQQQDAAPATVAQPTQKTVDPLDDLPF